jgi:hypothetical protein
MNPLKKIAVGLALSAAILLPTAAAHASPAPTSAVIGGGTGASVTYSNTPGAVTLNVDCSAISGQISIQPFASALNGWSGGQWVSYRYALTADTGQSGTSPWQGPTLAARSYGPTRLPTQRLGVARGHEWNVWVQVAWWTGSAYAYSGWYSPNVITINGGYTPAMWCFT